jgi:diadenosine tetraphosphate (Ap4A) HIT family hydrolase
MFRKKEIFTMQLSREEYNKLIKKKKIFKKHECPFCLNQEKEKKLLLRENKHWKVIYNKFPYGDIKKHLLAFPKRHVELTKDLTKQEYASFLEVEQFIFDFFK